MHLDAVNYRRDKFESAAMIERILQKSVPERRMGTPGFLIDRPINAPGHWDYFLCHGQAGAGDQVNRIAFLLEERGKTVWYDMNMTDRSTDAMVEGCSHCANFIVFLSGEQEFQDNGAKLGWTSTAEQLAAYKTCLDRCDIRFSAHAWQPCATSTLSGVA